MLAIVKSSQTIRSCLQYNEQKVAANQALLLDAHNFWQEKEDLTMREKLQRFHDLSTLNERSKKQAIHISVNFHPDDRLTDRQMTRIAAAFMEGIGFGDQPWLLYRHIDAGHPHFHIVSTNIRPDGSRIDNDLRSPHHLMHTCHKIATDHHLTEALPLPDRLRLLQQTSPEEYLRLIQASAAHRLPDRPTSLRYGERPTKTAIAEVLQYVLERYSFDSFESYNAVLGLYHVRADRGREDSAMFENRGLYYRMIDAEGKKLGAPIKASDFDRPVTLKALENKFGLSERFSHEDARRITSLIDYNLMMLPPDYSLRMFRRQMADQQIRVVIPALTQRPSRGQKPAAAPKNPDDGHGICYVDFNSMTAVRDTTLGQQYTADAILRRTGVRDRLLELAAENQLRLKPREQAILRPDYPDAEETRRLLLKLSAQHDEIADRKESMRQQQELSQRQRHRQGLSL
ncbi:MAG TPA: relaxase/mobilization nuclease domain-containing protein [Puia sp.]|nr:relaxase/mobilization nuclease domain-containing protein [Puia sp.]